MPTSFLALDSSLFHFYTALSFVLYYSPSFSQQRRKKGVVSFCVGRLFLLEMRAASFFTADGCCPQNQREKEKQARQKRLFSRAKGKWFCRWQESSSSRVDRSLCDVLFSMRGKYTQAKARARLF
jgi:hypothetical protein